MRTTKAARLISLLPCTVNTIPNGLNWETSKIRQTVAPCTHMQASKGTILDGTIYSLCFYNGKITKQTSENEVRSWYRTMKNQWMIVKLNVFPHKTILGTRLKF
jgi:hypothetical protein